MWVFERQARPELSLTSHAWVLLQLGSEHPRPSFHGLQRRTPPFNILTVWCLSALMFLARLSPSALTGVAAPKSPVALRFGAGVSSSKTGCMDGALHSKCVCLSASLSASSARSPRLTQVAIWELVVSGHPDQRASPIEHGIMESSISISHGSFQADHG